MFMGHRICTIRWTLAYENGMLWGDVEKEGFAVGFWPPRGGWYHLMW